MARSRHFHPTTKWAYLVIAVRTGNEPDKVTIMDFSTIKKSWSYPALSKPAESCM